MPPYSPSLLSWFSESANHKWIWPSLSTAFIGLCWQEHRKCTGTPASIQIAQLITCLYWPNRTGLEGTVFWAMTLCHWVNVPRLSKHRETLTQRHGVMPQKTWIITILVAGSQNYPCWSTWMLWFFVWWFCIRLP
jgi:hypothetical protein